MTGVGGGRTYKPPGQFVSLLKVQLRLGLREPYAFGLGVGLPIILLVVFGLISKQVPGNVANTGLTVIDLYVPTLLVISFISIAISLPNTVVRDREIGWLRRVSTTPVSPLRLLAAQLAVDLVIAAIAIVIVLVGAVTIFGAQLSVGIPFFVLSILLAIAEIFSLGLVVVALAPSQTAATAVGGVLFFLLLFLSGLWVQPLQISGPLQTIMFYSPTGAAARAILYSVYNTTPPIGALVAMACYTAVFAFVAVRFFRWE